MASKLDALTTALKTDLGKLKDAQKEMLTHRIQINTLHTTTIPGLYNTLRDAVAGGAMATIAKPQPALDMRMGQIDNLLTTFNNNGAWVRKFIGDVSADIDSIDTHLANYDTMRTKKNKSLPMDRCEARQKKKTAAAALVAKARTAVTDARATLAHSPI